MKERLYLFLGLFFVTIPAFAIEPATAMLISAGVSALSGNFGADFENPAGNLQVATQASSMAAEQADISLASTLDTLRATGASAGGATALARAAAQSKRGVSAQIEQQEARNAQLRAQGELQAASIRQRAETLQYQAISARENQALNRAASLESSASQQAAAYGSQSRAMIGQAVGAVGSVVAGGLIGEGTFMENLQTNFGKSNTENQYNTIFVDGANPKVNTNSSAPFSDIMNFRNTYFNQGQNTFNPYTTNIVPGTGYQPSGYSILPRNQFGNITF